MRGGRKPAHVPCVKDGGVDRPLPGATDGEMAEPLRRHSISLQPIQVELIHVRDVDGTVTEIHEDQRLPGAVRNKHSPVRQFPHAPHKAEFLWERGIGLDQSELWDLGAGSHGV